MSLAKFDVCAIGNAIVDVIAESDDVFLSANGIAKGTMSLIDSEKADTLYKKVGPAIEVSGGSAANTVAGIASLGGNPAYIGKVRNDQLGEIFRHDMIATGVHYATPPLTGGPATAVHYSGYAGRSAQHEHVFGRVRGVCLGGHR